MLKLFDMANSYSYSHADYGYGYSQGYNLYQPLSKGSPVAGSPLPPASRSRFISAESL